MTSVKYIILFATSTALISCGGDAGLSAASGTVSAAAANNVKMRTELDKLVTELTASIQTPGNSVPGGITTSAIQTLQEEQDPFASCTQVTPSALVDADADGISELKKYVYNCSNVPYGQYTTNKNGTVTIMDLDDDVTTGDGGGYSFEYDLVQNTPGYYSSEWTGLFKFERTGTSYLYTSQFKSIFTESHSGQDITGGVQSNYTHKLEAEDATKPWDKGSSLTDGYYRVIVQGDDGQGNILDWDFTFKIKSEVTYESTGTSSCTYYYKDGYLEFTDASNNTLRYTYACDSYTFSFNGQTIYTTP